MAKINKTNRASGIDNTKAVDAGKSDTFLVSYPILWLILATIIVYSRVLQLGLTELDDTIFIRDFHEYNEHLGNLLTSFHRGLFDAVKDPYYRPLFLDSMILNYWLSGHGQNIMVYHLFNLVFHLISVILLYQLFLKLNLKIMHAFLLAIFFAIHPVLTQAVAWIPGRNDTLLAIFVLSFLNYAIAYSKTGKVAQLILSAFFLILAYFTKETAVFAAPVAFIMIVYMLHTKMFDRRNIIQYLLWAGCFVFWFVVRSKATIQASPFSPQTFTDFVHRLPLIVQYIGKIFLPVNLSVFPMQDDTVYYYGIASLIILAAIIYYSNQRNTRQIIGGFAVFILFLLPALFVPSNLNEQTFEHRLYLPIIGILLVLPQTILFTWKYTDGQLLMYSFLVFILFAGRTFNHQQDFADPYTFWKQAEETSPNSSFAVMHLSEYEDNLETKCALIRRAYQLNPKEKYINFFYAEMLFNTNKRDSIMAAEAYLITEKGISNFYKCNFYLARIAVEKSDFNTAVDDLTDFLKSEPETSKEGAEANNNLLVIYLNTHQTNKLIYQAKHMKELGMQVPEEIIKQYHL